MKLSRDTDGSKYLYETTPLTASVKFAAARLGKILWSFRNSVMSEMFIVTNSFFLTDEWNLDAEIQPYHGHYFPRPLYERISTRLSILSFFYPTDKPTRADFKM